MKVLNVAEKHDAAKNISAHLSRGTSTMSNGKCKYNKIFHFRTNVPQLGGECDMVMTSVSGHLMNFDFDDSLRKWHSCRPDALFMAPIKECIPNEAKFQTARQIKMTLEMLAKQSQALVIWTDGDREGENIGFEIIRVCHAVNRNLRVMRAKFSEITGRAMNIAINNLVEPDENLSKAVDIRRELDLRFGSVFTRYQSLLLQGAGYTGGGPTNNPNSDGRARNSVVSYGPCQFPTMGFVINRYLEILRFVPQKFWVINMSHRKEKLQANFNWKRHRLFEEHACLAFYTKIMENPKARVINVNGKQKSNWRPEPMYTTSMEKLASSKLRIPAKEALNIAEKLYTSGFISYPRTETNIFPKGMNLRQLVEQQTGHSQWGSFAQRIINEGGPTPRYGKKTDNAHPPIHPTKPANNNELHGKEASMYELITRHFLACCSQDAKGLETIVTVDMNGETFSANGLIILEKNYLEVYPYTKWNAKEIPRYDQNEEFVPDSILMNEGKTCPPQLLTESELIALMEKHGIGTDATHAEHIDKIQERNYVKKLPRVARFCPTKLGLALYDGYHAMQFTHLIKPELRSRLERDLVKIAENERSAREVANEYIEEHKSIFQVVDREKDKLVRAFISNKEMLEPELRLKQAFPADYN